MHVNEVSPPLSNALFDQGWGQLNNCITQKHTVTLTHTHSTVADLAARRGATVAAYWSGLLSDSQALMETLQCSQSAGIISVIKLYVQPRTTSGDNVWPHYNSRHV